MALIKCPECDGTVSSKASACPHCGWIVTGIPPILPPQQGLPPKDLQQAPFKTNDKSEGNATAVNTESKGSGWGQAIGVVIGFLILLGLNKGFPDLKLLDSLPFERDRIQRAQADEVRRSIMDEKVKKIFEESQERIRRPHQAP